MSVVNSVLTASAQPVDAVGHPGITTGLLGESVYPTSSTVVLPVIGLQVGYRVGRSGGSRSALRQPGSIGLNEQRPAWAGWWFERWGDAVGLLGRLVSGIRNLASTSVGTL